MPQQPANTVACGLPLNDFLRLQVNQSLREPEYDKTLGSQIEPTKLNNRLSVLVNVASTGDYAPTAQSFEVRDMLPKSTSCLPSKTKSSRSAKRIGPVTLPSFFGSERKVQHHGKAVRFDERFAGSARV